MNTFRILTTFPGQFDQFVVSHWTSSFLFLMDQGKKNLVMSTVGSSTNIVWHECPVGKLERQKLLKQKGCVIWITGLSGSGLLTKEFELNFYYVCLLVSCMLSLAMMHLKSQVLPCNSLIIYFLYLLHCM